MHVEIENNAIILYTVGLSSQVAIYSYFMCYDALLNLDGSSILNCQKCCLSFYRSSLSDNTLTGCWRLEQVGQHSSDEDDLFSSMKSRRYTQKNKLFKLLNIVMSMIST